MADIVWSDVTDHVNALTSTPVNVQTTLLAYVNSRVVVSCFDGEDGPTTKLARIYLAAHFATPTGSGGAGTSGPVSSEKEGDVAVTYASSYSMVTTELGTTSYGLNYLMLVRTSAARSPLLL